MAQQRIALHLPGLTWAAGGRSTTLPLEQAESLQLRGDRRGASLYCSRGALWVTQSGDPVDHILRAGESMTVTRRGLVLVQALVEAAVQVKPL